MYKCRNTFALNVFAMQYAAIIWYPVGMCCLVEFESYWGRLHCNHKGNYIYVYIKSYTLIENSEKSLFALQS